MDSCQHLPKSLLSQLYNTKRWVICLWAINPRFLCRRVTRFFSFSLLVCPTFPSSGDQQQRAFPAIRPTSCSQAAWRCSSRFLNILLRLSFSLQPLLVDSFRRETQRKMRIFLSSFVSEVQLLSSEVCAFTIKKKNTANGLIKEPSSSVFNNQLFEKKEMKKKRCSFLI